MRRRDVETRSPLPMKSAFPPALNRLIALCFLFAVFAARGQRLEYEEEPHRYWSAELTDSCTEVDKALVAGQLKLTLDDSKTMAREVLAALKVPVESQVLVFSKTSLQKDRISPSTP